MTVRVRKPVWRIIDDSPHDAFANMAIDEAISQAVRSGDSPPTVRLYQWSRPSVSIGYFQKISDINTACCRGLDYPVVRRITGGMAILHEHGLTYSISARTGLEAFRGGLLKNYIAVSNALLHALKLLNIDARINLKKIKPLRDPSCFRSSSYGEITIESKKIIGSAQKRYIDGFLQQGSIMLGLDMDNSAKIMRDYVKDNDSKEPPAPSVSGADLRKAVRKGFEKAFNIYFEDRGLTDPETDLSKKLEADKYSSTEWTFRR